MYVYFYKILNCSEVIATELTNVVSGTSIACNLGSARLLCPQTGRFCHSWARSTGCCTDAAQTQWPWGLTVCGSAVCLAAACAPESEVSADMEMRIYELTFILVSHTV